MIPDHGALAGLWPAALEAHGAVFRVPCNLPSHLTIAAPYRTGVDAGAWGTEPRAPKPLQRCHRLTRKNRR